MGMRTGRALGNGRSVLPVRSYALDVPALGYDLATAPADPRGRQST
jgi:hypothetical protein